MQAVKIICGRKELSVARIRSRLSKGGLFITRLSCQTILHVRMAERHVFQVMPLSVKRVFDVNLNWTGSYRAGG